MTSLLAALVLAQTAPPLTQNPAVVLEAPQPGSGRVVLQAHFRMPFAPGSRESAAWRVLIELLKEGTLDFTSSQMIEQGGGAGFRFYAGQDFLTLQLSGSKGSLDAQAQIIESMMLRPRLRSEEILAKSLQLSRVGTDPLMTAAKQEAPEWTRLRVEHVLDLQKQVMRPENLALVAGGDFEPGSADKILLPRFRAMPPAPRRSPVRFDPPAPPARRMVSGLRAVKVSAPLKSSSLEEAALSMILVGALTQGKGSSLYKKVREEKGEAYQVSGSLMPGLAGWRLEMTVIQRAERTLTPDQVTALLIEDVNSWGAVDLARAKAMTLAGLTQETYDALLAVGGERIRPGIETEAFVLGAAQGRLRLNELEGQIERVDLAGLKAAALAALQSADGSLMLP